MCPLCPWLGWGGSWGDGPVVGTNYSIQFNSCLLQPDMKTGKVDLGLDSGNGRNIGRGVTEDSSIALCYKIGFMFSCIMRLMILDLFKATVL